MMRLRHCLIAGLIAGAPASAQLDVTTSFEGITSDDFVVGAAPTSAHFTGGSSMSPGLARTGLFSWMVFDDGRTGNVAFEAPADIVDFWVIDSMSEVQGRVRAIGLGGETLAEIDPGLMFSNHRLEGLGPIARLEIINNDTGLGESTSVDDFGFRAVRPIEDPIPGGIPTSDTPVRLRRIADGLTAPNLLVTAPDGSGRLFVVDQAGQIRIIEDGALAPEPFLDVSGRLPELGIFGTMDPFGDFDERGLLGLAFHPQYATGGAAGFGKLYTYISQPVSGPADFTTAEPPPAGQQFNHQSAIVEWTVDPANPDRVDPASDRTLMLIDQPQFNHNAGEIRFGPDGLLYIALGDGGGADDEDTSSRFGHGPAGNGQNIETVHGSILRIDPLKATGALSANGQYSIPGDNPFVGRAGIDEIYAYGFRNPFRFSFGPGGELIVADVGQNDIEEVSIISRGDNAGWRILEGDFRFVPNGEEDGFVIDNFDGVPDEVVPPRLQYDHDEGLSVIGGFVYTGDAIPALAGKYIFGDFSTRFARPDGRLFCGDLATGAIEEFAESARGLGLFIKGFGQDDAGEVFVLAGINLGPFGNFGEVYQIVDGSCGPDCDASGSLDFFDFLCFQNQFAAGDLRADCDGSGSLDLFDFLCFQNEFAAGCP
ncbi:MAG: PQQ-dependent sugar dehydrogenase [Phycisphaerales bacterium JB039]